MVGAKTFIETGKTKKTFIWCRKCVIKMRQLPKWGEFRCCKCDNKYSFKLYETRRKRYNIRIDDDFVFEDPQHGCWDKGFSGNKRGRRKWVSYKRK